jgi:hypothetical protein
MQHEDSFVGVGLTLPKAAKVRVEQICDELIGCIAIGISD